MGVILQTQGQLKMRCDVGEGLGCREVGFGNEVSDICVGMNSGLEQNYCSSDVNLGWRTTGKDSLYNVDVSSVSALQSG